MKISILISKTSWANKYIYEIKKLLKHYGNVSIINNHKNISKNTFVNIIFSYFSIIKEKYLRRSIYNLVTHESNLPKGRGMSPLTWQILNGKKKFTFSLFEAESKLDSGRVYLKKKVYIPKHATYNEIKNTQFINNINLIIKFLQILKKKKKVRSYPQKGKPTFYKKRNIKDHRIDINKSIKSQINLLRTSDNENYPCNFIYARKKYLIQIKKL